jgi:hypothetical protein
MRRAMSLRVLADGYLRFLDMAAAIRPAGSGFAAAAPVRLFEAT